MSETITFTSREELDKYNTKLLSDFIEYLNKKNKNSHKVFNCGASIQIVGSEELIKEYVNHIRLKDNCDKSTDKEPLKLYFPYKITLHNKKEASEYIRKQCNNCPKYNATFDCSGNCAAKCSDVVLEVENYFKE